MTSTQPTHVSQYTPTEDIPALGAAELHPALDVPLLRDLIHPDHALWTGAELRELTELVATELAGELFNLLEVHPRQRWWARLGLTAGVELWLLSWAPGQGTRPHDHGGAAGSFTVLSGELREDYRYPAGPVRVTHRTTGSSIGFGPGRAHQVRNLAQADAASVHAYSPPLLPVRHYASLADVPPVLPEIPSAQYVNPLLPAEEAR